MNTIEFGTKKIKIVKSRRSRYLRLSVNPQGEIKLSAPLATMNRQITTFLEQQDRWLETVLAKLPASHKLAFKDGEQVNILDRPFRLVVNQDYTGQPKAYIDNSTQQIFLLFGKDSSKVEVSERLNSALRKYARTIISQQLPVIAEQMRISYQKVSVREQRSRWGSCSSNGNLSFNWKIMLTPVSVFKYVLVHELAHIPQPNHSANFWAIVEKFHPTYKQDRLWLKQNANSLEIL